LHDEDVFPADRFEEPDRHLAVRKAFDRGGRE
jgi:hypothetical protein